MLKLSISSPPDTTSILRAPSFSTVAFARPSPEDCEQLEICKFGLGYRPFEPVEAPWLSRLSWSDERQLPNSPPGHPILRRLLTRPKILYSRVGAPVVLCISFFLDTAPLHQALRNNKYLIQRKCASLHCTVGSWRCRRLNCTCISKVPLSRAYSLP